MYVLIQIDRGCYTHTYTRVHMYTDLDTEVVCFVNGDMHINAGMLNLLPRWSTQVNMTVAYMYVCTTVPFTLILTTALMIIIIPISYQY